MHLISTIVNDLHCVFSPAVGFRIHMGLMDDFMHNYACIHTHTEVHPWLAPNVHSAYDLGWVGCTFSMCVSLVTLGKHRNTPSVVDHAIVSSRQNKQTDKQTNKLSKGLLRHLLLSERIKHESSCEPKKDDNRQIALTNCAKFPEVYKSLVIS